MEGVHIPAFGRVQKNFIDVVEYGEFRDRQSLQMVHEDMCLLLKLVVASQIGLAHQEGHTKVCGPDMEGLEKCFLSDDTF